MIAADLSYVHILAFGDNTVVLLTTESADDNAGIIKAQVYSMTGNAPETYLGGLMSLVALTDMPDDQHVLMTLIMQEHPLWQDLCEMLPIAGWNGKLLVVCEHGSEEDEYILIRLE